MVAQVLMFFLPPPLLYCPLVDPQGTVCHHQPWVPCQRQMGIREWSTSPFLSPPTDLERRGVKEWQLFTCSCPDRRPQPCCSHHATRWWLHAAKQELERRLCPQEASPARVLVCFTQNRKPTSCTPNQPSRLPSETACWALS